jgi:siroheme synthase-like protein
MPHAYPMMLDVTDRPVVIIGGGSVAARKAAGLIECGATRVRCVAPEFDLSMRKEVERVAARYEPSHLDGAGLVFAATNNAAVNAAVVRDARARGVLVNRVDAGEETPGDFITPARFREAETITVTVSAGSPALAVLIRNEIARRWDPRWSRMAEAMQELRPVVVARQDLHERRRRQIFTDLATQEAMNVLANGGTDALRAWLAARFPELSQP